MTSDQSVSVSNIEDGTPLRTSTRSPKPKRFPEDYEGIAYLKPQSTSTFSESLPSGPKRKATAPGKRRGRPPKTPKIDSDTTASTPLGITQRNRRQSDPSQSTPPPNPILNPQQASHPGPTTFSTPPTETSSQFPSASKHNETGVVLRGRWSLSNDDLAKEVRVGRTATIIDAPTKSMEHTAAGAQGSALTRDLAATSHSRPALTTVVSEGENLQVATMYAPHSPPPCKITSVACVSPNILSSRNELLSGDPSGTTRVQLHGMENVSMVNGATLNNVTAADSDDKAYDTETEGSQQANNGVNPTQSSTHSSRLPLNSSDAEFQDLAGSRHFRDQLQGGPMSLENGIQPSAQSRPFESSSCPTTQAYGKETAQTVTETQVVGKEASPGGMAKAVISASQFSKQPELEDDDVNELGRLVVKHRDLKNILQSAQSKLEECGQKINDLEKNISCEQLVLADVRQRIETLQEEEKIKKQLVSEKREELETELASLHEFTSQAEVTKKRMSEVWVKLGL
ncbi:hypothetical protein LTS18_004456 [Coniosporium uncinatum]|uniref:Uncharacterized protein n=1 Tax=Coniosporium uncinatum TaxID=93489 RepID=A0ACC3D5N9_9PEZI|nr:hypothetical protein LTS18_004456 [Coniosporium uncinatum]